MTPAQATFPYLSRYLSLDAPTSWQPEDLSPEQRTALSLDLREILTAYAAYIPARLLHHQLREPQPGRVQGAFWQGSLLFADLSGFTALSEKLSVLGRQGAEEVSGIINHVFDGLIAEVNRHQGMLLKFGGDALTAFFDADTLGLAHASAATSAALGMQQRMADFDHLETRAGTFRLGLRVGVHSGRLFAAEVGDSSHIELVVTGHEVNRVALAQEIAYPGEVVITDETVALLKGVELDARDAGFHRVRRLLFLALPQPLAPPLQADGADDLASLEWLAARVLALRPYLIRRLPRRFLETSDIGLGEFRPVTVMFVNFYDFSAMLEVFGDDAEGAAVALNAYFQRAQAVIQRYDGVVNKVDMYTHGDKIMALFGAPLAHEDDTLRAVRCALELDQALHAANADIADLLPSDCRPNRLAHKIGINTGIVFAGRVGGTQRYEYTVMGPAVNLAARLMTAAAEQTTLISSTTRFAVEHVVDVAEQPPLALKGLAEPIVPARLVGVRAQQLRQAKSVAGMHLPALVGRDREFARLTQAAARALNGSGGLIALVGDAGTGKTRLLEELLHYLVFQSGLPTAAGGVPSFALCSNDCQSYDQLTSYSALRAILRPILHMQPSETAVDPSAARLPDAPAASISRQIDARVAYLAPELRRFAPLLSDVSGVVLPESDLTRALSPQQRHDRLQDLLVALMLGAVDESPLVVMIEDVHWIDPSSLEIIQRLSQILQTVDVPLLLLLSYRTEPPIAAPWESHSHSLRLHLPELSGDSSKQLLQQLLAGVPPPEMLPLLERSQGNPYFIEEMVRSLIETDTLRRDAAGAWQFAADIEQVAVPNSIEGLLLTRLDRLDEARHELVQSAAVIGRRFSHAIVAGLHPDVARVDADLQSLARDAMIIRDHQEPEPAYLFRHTLLRDVAYQGILYARRRELHGKVARRIEIVYANYLDEYLAILADHYLRAESWELAFHYHVAAGRKAQQRFANQSALTLFQTALALAPRLAVSRSPATSVARLVEIHERLGDLQLLLAEYAAAEAHYREGLRLLAAQPDTNHHSRVRLHRLLATLFERRSDYDAAFDWIARALAIAADTPLEQARCELVAAMLHFRRGEYDPALELARQGLAIAEALEAIADQAYAHLLIGTLRRDQGDFAAGIAAIERARTLFEQINDLNQLSNTLNNLGMVYQQTGRWQQSVESYERSLAISENIGDVLAVARTSNNLAVILVGRNELQRAAEMYKLSSEQFARIGSQLGVAVTTYNRGEVLLLQGRAEAALELFQHSIVLFEQIKVRNFLPEVLRLAAEATLALEQIAAAHEYAARSLALADELGMTVEVAAAHRVQGQIALYRHDLAPAAMLLNQALSELQPLDNRYELGKVLVWLARLARYQDRIDQAREQLAQAERIFQELDAQRDLAALQSVRDEFAGFL
jgi:class 3 adenylate cyclase/tetratricopeptide (TPR) repeat protein